MNNDIAAFLSWLRNEVILREQFHTTLDVGIILAPMYVNLYLNVFAFHMIISLMVSLND